MDNVKEYRDDARFDHEATILIEDFTGGAYYHGKMINYSESGMCFESQVLHEPGAPIIFCIEDSPYPACPGVYHGQIKWCRSLTETDSLYSFGMGVEYFKNDFLFALQSKSQTGLSRMPSAFLDENTARTLDGQPGIEDVQEIPAEIRQGTQKDLDENHRKHPRRPFGRSVLYATRNRFFKGTIKDISKGGVFIEAPDMMAVGLPLTLAIPSGGQGRGLKLKGEIVRIDPNGLAIRFKSVIKN